MASSRPIADNATPLRGTLGRRQRLPELMDAPSLPAEEHRAALAGLARLNRLSGSAAGIWRTIRRRLPSEGAIELLDVACGGGDVVTGIARRARRAGVEVRVTACDVAPLALRVTRERLEREGVPATLVQVDALREELPGPADVVTCSLFLHHLERGAAVEALRAMANATRCLLLVDDLVRGAWGYALAAAVPQLVTRSSVVHVDARLSVRAAFSPRELAGLAAEAGLAEARVVRHWPARQLLVWEPDGVGRDAPTAGTP